MPITSNVTHINSTEEVGKPIAPLELYAELRTNEPEVLAEEKRSMFVKNPKLVMEEAQTAQKDLNYLWSQLDGAGRTWQAEEHKAAANAYFKDGKWRHATVGYVAGAWFARSNRTACPLVVALALSQKKTTDEAMFGAGLAEVSAWLRGGPGGTAAAESDAAATLRTSLHLNLAAAALKLLEWNVVKAACASVLAVDDAHAKALFRLAKAHEGEGDFAAAVSTVSKLLKSEPQNGDARRLLDALRKRQAEEKEKFKGMFAGGEEAK
jgi:tetratricopeptide (TPR) repeat protein